MVSPERNAIKGSTTTSRAPTRRMPFSISGMSSGIERSRSWPFSSGTVARARILDVSAPAASRRGRIVSAKPSSAESSTTPAGAHGAPSGKLLPADTRAARSRVMALFPSPGSPSTSASFPRASHEGQSHETSSDSTPERSVPISSGLSSSTVRSVPSASLTVFGTV